MYPRPDTDLSAIRTLTEAAVILAFCAALAFWSAWAVGAV